MGVDLLVQELRDRNDACGSEPFRSGMLFAAPLIGNEPSQMRGYGTNSCQQTRAFRYTVVTPGVHPRSLLVPLQSRPAARSR